MSSPQRSIFIVGSGPMIGTHVARLFASHGFHSVALFSRSPANLARDASTISSSSPITTVRTYPADVTDHAALRAALETAVSDLGGAPPEVVVYNAARIRYGPVGRYSTDDIMADFAVPNLGLYTTASVMLPHLRALAAKSRPEEARHPALFVTSGNIIHEPLAQVFSLSMAKTAQASLVRVLARENQGVVHVALVTVGGVVAPEEEVRNPANIAEKFWGLYGQERGKWEFEVRCGW